MSFIGIFIFYNSKSSSSASTASFLNQAPENYIHYPNIVLPKYKSFFSNQHHRGSNNNVNNNNNNTGIEILNHIIKKLRQQEESIYNKDQDERGLEEGEDTFSFSIVHTNDLHSHFEGQSPDHLLYRRDAHHQGNPSTTKRGDFSRLSYVISKLQDHHHHHLSSSSSEGETRARRHGHVVTLDDGDLFVGTLFFEIALSALSRRVPEFEFIHRARFDAITFGNHCVENRIAKLASLLQKASRANFSVPIVATNLLLKPPQTNSSCSDSSDENDLDQAHLLFEHYLCGFKDFYRSPAFSSFAKDPLQNLFADEKNGSFCSNSTATIRPFRIIELARERKKAFRIGILGAMSPNAAFLSATGLGRRALAFFGFDDASSAAQYSRYYEFIQRAVDHLRLVERVDCVLFLGHQGFPEDVALVRNVHGIDIHISAHTHFEYSIKEKKKFPNAFSDDDNEYVYISQAGAYGSSVGYLNVKAQRKKGKLPNNEQRKEQQGDNYNIVVTNFDDYMHIPIDSSIPDDPQMHALIQDYKGEIDAILGRKGLDLKYDTVLASVKQSYPLDKKVATFIVSGLRLEVNAILAEKSSRLPDLPAIRPVDIYYSGQIFFRTGFVKAEGHEETLLQFSDIFRVLGVSSDSAVVDFYLTKREVFLLIEIQQIYTDWIEYEFRPVYSDSLKFHFRPFAGIPFWNNIQNLSLHEIPYEKWPPLVHLATNEKLAKYFFVRHPFSFLLHFEPRDESGSPLTEQQLMQRSLGRREFELFASFLKKNNSTEIVIP